MEKCWRHYVKLFITMIYVSTAPTPAAAKVTHIWQRFIHIKSKKMLHIKVWNVLFNLHSLFCRCNLRGIIHAFTPRQNGAQAHIMSKLKRMPISIAKAKHEQISILISAYKFITAFAAAKMDLWKKGLLKYILIWNTAW